MIQLECGDFRELIHEVPDGTVQAVLTDPAYAKKYWHLISHLGREAYRVLSDDGWLVVIGGNYTVPAWPSMLVEAGFVYRWTGWLLHTGPVGVRPEIRMRARGKPIYFLSKHWKTRPYKTLADTIIGGGMEKGHHEWGQDLDSAMQLVDAFTLPGEKILDPFAGGGTFLVAAMRLRRRAIGYEILPRHYLDAGVWLDTESDS